LVQSAFAKPDMILFRRLVVITGRSHQQAHADHGEYHGKFYEKHQDEP